MWTSSCQFTYIDVQSKKKKKYHCITKGAKTESHVRCGAYDLQKKKKIKLNNTKRIDPFLCHFERMKIYANPEQLRCQIAKNFYFTFVIQLQRFLEMLYPQFSIYFLLYFPQIHPNFIKA